LAITITLYGALFGLLLIATLTDVARLRIANVIPIAISVLFLPYAVATQITISDLGWHIAAGSSVLAIGFLLFAAGAKFGGGDAKLFSALALWCGFSKLAALFVLTSLVGGVLAILVFLLRQTSLPKWLSRRGINIPALAIDRSQPYVPFAPAMAISFILTCPTYHP
jgi:prepilin peptidase CpaA